MRGAKPKAPPKSNVHALPGAAEKLENHQAALDAAERRNRKQAKKDAKRLMPRGLSAEMKAEFLRVGALLAHPDVDRLKAHYVDAILEYCHCTIRLRAFREALPTIQREVYSAGAGRNGTLIKTHPLVPQMNETWRRWRSLVAILGLSPTDERNMAPGLGKTGDGTDKYFS
jgi:phage terminase small subunit